MSGLAAMKNLGKDWIERSEQKRAGALNQVYR